MARVTVEDCIEKVPNRFELVLMAARRTKELEKGGVPTVQRDNDKFTIVALREVAGDTISLPNLMDRTRNEFSAKKESVSENINEEIFKDSDIPSIAAKIDL